MQLYLQIYNESRKFSLLSKVLNMFYSKRLPKYFFRWKLYSQSVESKFYNFFFSKNVRLKKVIEKKIAFMNDQARRKLYYWRMQVRHKFPLYDERDIGRKVLKRILQNDCDSRKRGSRSRASIFSEPGQPKRVSIIAIALKLESAFTETIESKFTCMKRVAMDRFSSLYLFENQIIKSKQPLLLRTLRLKEQNYFNYFDAVKKSELKPSTLLEIVKNKDINPEDDLEQRRSGGLDRGYLNGFMVKKKHQGSKKTTATLLLSGVWSSNEPYLRFREYFMMKVIQNNYLNNVITAYTNLKAFSARIEKRNDLKLEFAQENKQFKLVWGKLYMKIILQDRVYIAMNSVFQGLEVYKRSQEIMSEIRQSRDDPKPRSKSPQTQKNIQKITQTQMRQSLSERYEIIKRDFANGFLNILLDASLSKSQVKEELSAYVFKSLHFLIVEGFEKAAQLISDDEP